MANRRSDLLSRLVAVADDLGPLLAAGGATPLLGAIARATRHACGAAACSVAVLDGDAELVYRAADGEGADAVVGLRLPVSRGIAGFVAQSGQGIAIDEVRRDPRFAIDVAERSGYVPRTLVAAPALDAAESVVGVVTILDPDASRVDALAQASLAGREAGLALVLDRATADLGRLLLAAAADAAPDNDLAAGLRRVAERTPGPDAELARLAALLAELGALGPAEGQAAERLLGEFAVYARSRRRR